MKLDNDNIIELNKDVESFVIQAGRQRSSHNFKELFGDKAVPLTFVHASDMHNVPDLWNRMVEYINYYSEYISFAVHTGDYCGGNQLYYTDMYAECTECIHPIYNCPGNHDCVGADNNWSIPAKKETVHNLLYNHTKNWDVNFMECEHSMSYYKDFPESNIRLIVLDLYYDIWKARRWLAGLLEEAYKNGLHVITAMHEPTDYIEESFGVKFHSIDDYRAVYEKYERDRATLSFDHRDRVTFEDIIAEFIKKGGNYVCNLAGHDHHDAFGLTNRGVLNVVVENGTSGDKLGDSRRVKGTKSYDCFNVVGVDTDLGLLKLIRVGNNVDHYMREKRALCFDYINKKVIFNG